ncbi:glycosyl hydrolase family 85-domain-containing protein [Globomyces pollinis-pini]|nr:glycosyl hydrolase family 85-domain-containing protein [Globomyces pollinis-pini]
MTSPQSFPIDSVEDLGEHIYDPFNICRIPLRPRVESNQKVILCHDMMNGYHQDAEIQGGERTETIYSFQYWQFVDIFIYFSHHRFTIPPVNWTIACHRNGVKCLGTFIVEWQNGLPDLLRLIYGPNYDEQLPSTQRDFDPYYANKMIEITEFYGFDGWLINVESIIPSAIHAIVLKRFLDYLTKTIHVKKPGSLIIWYDSVIYTGQLRWQDQLNVKNKMFFDVTDAIFVNYTWNPAKLQESRDFANNRKDQVFTGIDVWGRNTFGGGGFNTHKALREISKVNLQIAIFAPGWTFESLGKEHFAINERRFWCDTNQDIPILPGEDQSTAIDLKDIGCVSQYIDLKAGAGITNFHSNFNQGFGSKYFIHGELVSNIPWHHLAQQNIPLSYPVVKPNLSVVKNSLIKNPSDSWVDLELQGHDSYLGGSSIAVTSAQNCSTAELICIPLYKVNICTNKNSKFRLIYKQVKGAVLLGLYWKTNDNLAHIKFATGEKIDHNWMQIESTVSSSGFLTEIGIAVGSFSRIPSDCIKLPLDCQEVDIPPFEVQNCDSFEYLLGSITIYDYIPTIHNITGKLVVERGEPKIQNELISVTLNWASLELNVTEKLDMRLIYIDSVFIGASFNNIYVANVSQGVKTIEIRLYNELSFFVGKIVDTITLN